MITFITHVRVMPENVPAFEALLADVQAKTRVHEPGVVYYSFGRSAEDPETYVVIEVYRDAEAHAGHMATAWVRESFPRALQLMLGKPDIRQYVSPGTEPTLRFS